MSQKMDILTPVGRLVQGSLYEGQTTDAENRPLVYKSGANQGQPRVDYYFALAIPKGLERHWAETEWGKKIWDVGHAGFPNGQAQHPSFAWKVIDGDSTIPNKAGKKPCDREGYPGCWILNFSSSFPSQIYNENGTKLITESKYVNLGDYVEVFGYVTDNGSQQQPGVYLNHSMVAFRGFGERIFLGIDPKSVGFGQSTLPAGASKAPVGQALTTEPAPVTTAAPAPMPTPVTTAAPAPAPYPQILTPPAPAPVKVMTAKANGVSYEDYIKSGWTDELLIQHGFMQA